MMMFDVKLVRMVVEEISSGRILDDGTCFRVAHGMAISELPWSISHRVRGEKNELIMDLPESDEIRRQVRSSR